MKVNGHHQHEMERATMRHGAKARSGAVATSDAATPAPAAPTAKPTSTAALAPIESTVEMAARKLPPGLVRVAARFEAMGVEGRTGGQSNAMAQITRNLQHYMETQGVAPPPAPVPDAPVVLPAVLGSLADTVTPVVAPSDGEVAAIEAVPEATVKLAEPILV